MIVFFMSTLMMTILICIRRRRWTFIHRLGGSPSLPRGSEIVFRDETSMFSARWENQEVALKERHTIMKDRQLNLNCISEIERHWPCLVSAGVVFAGAAYVYLAGGRHVHIHGLRLVVLVVRQNNCPIRGMFCLKDVISQVLAVSHGHSCSWL